jgi:hypothetical protein
MHRFSALWSRLCACSLLVSPFLALLFPQMLLDERAGVVDEAPFKYMCMLILCVCVCVCFVCTRHFKPLFCSLAYSFLLQTPSLSSTPTTQGRVNQTPLLNPKCVCFSSLPHDIKWWWMVFLPAPNIKKERLFSSCRGRQPGEVTQVTSPQTRRCCPGLPPPPALSHHQTFKNLNPQSCCPAQFHSLFSLLRCTAQRRCPPRARPICCGPPRASAKTRPCTAS